MAFFLGAVFDSAPPRAAAAHARASKARLRVTLAIALLALGIGCGSWLASLAFWNSDEVADDLEMVNATTPGSLSGPAGYEGTDEYTTLGADHYDLPHGRAAGFAGGDRDTSTIPILRQRLPDGSVVLETWQPEHKAFAVDSSRPVRAAVRLLNYPAWQVRVNGREVKAESDSNTGQMLLTLPSGHSEIDVRFARTPDRTFGMAISCFGIVMAAGMLFVSRRRVA